MRTILSIALAAGLSTTLLAATNASGDPSAASAPPAEGYYVVGITPSNADVEISTGYLEDGSFHQKRSFGTWSNTFHDRPESGFVFAKVVGEPTLALITVDLHDDILYRTIYTTCEKAGTGGGLMGALFAPSHPPHKTMTFAPPAGKVTYIGSVSFTKEADPDSDGRESILVPHYQNDIEGARAFLKSHHPEFADRLEQGAYTMIPSVGHCF